MFNCNRCGLCCRNIDKVSDRHEMALHDGTCKFLDKHSNLCTIYAHRPLFCNVDAYYKIFLTNEMSLEEYYKINEMYCKKLKELCNE